MSEISPPEAKLIWELCKRDCHTFIFGMDQGGERRHFVYTKR